MKMLRKTWPLALLAFLTLAGACAHEYTDVNKRLKAVPTPGPQPLPNVGPGAGSIGGGAAYVNSITLDAKGRVTAAVATTPGGGSIRTVLDFSPADIGVVQAASTSNASLTVGASFFLTVPSTLTGVRFYYPDTTTRNIKVTIWNAAGSVVATNTSSYNSVGVKTVTFGSPVSVGTVDLYKVFTVGMFHTAGGVYITMSAPTTVEPTNFPFLAGANFGLVAYNLNSGSGDAKPTSSSGFRHPIEPIYTIP